MIPIKEIAEEMDIDGDELIRESLKTYLHQKLVKINSEIFLIAKKHGIKNIAQLDSKLKKGIISEEDSYEDYFALDNLEAQRDKTSHILDNL